MIFGCGNIKYLSAPYEVTQLLRHAYFPLFEIVRRTQTATEGDSEQGKALLEEIEKFGLSPVIDPAGLGGHSHAVRFWLNLVGCEKDVRLRSNPTHLWKVGHEAGEW